MGVTLKHVDEAVKVLQGESSLPEGQEIMLFTVSDLKNLDRERRDEVDYRCHPSCAATKTKTPRMCFEPGKREDLRALNPHRRCAFQATN